MPSYLAAISHSMQKPIEGELMATGNQVVAYSIKNATRL